MYMYTYIYAYNCKPFGGPPTLSGPWTLHLGPFLGLKLGPLVYLHGLKAICVYPGAS